MVDGFSIWGGGMTAASSWLDAGGAEVDAVGADGCGGVVLSRGVVVVVVMELVNGRG